MQSFTLATLPEPVMELLLVSRSLANVLTYRAAKSAKSHRPQGADLFDLVEPVAGPEAEVKSGCIIWATDSYEEHRESFFSPVTSEKAHLITPRSEKAQAEQKKRTKDKAEVFTPSWVCNLQNNLVDDEVVYPGAFNTAESTSKTWEPSKDAVDFSKAKALTQDPQYSWVHYVAEKRLEITCGEGPYLFSRYDTVTGEAIPVRDAQGRYQRIGLMDRKFRIIAENVAKSDAKTWTQAALLALNSTYGYEWQGDNLLLARLNFVNTFVDYHVDFFGKQPSKSLLKQVAEIASWQLWQMDGLKMVRPLSCGDECKPCKDKKQTQHSGGVSVLRWSGEVKTFEDFLPASS